MRIAPGMHFHSHARMHARTLTCHTCTTLSTNRHINVFCRSNYFEIFCHCTQTLDECIRYVITMFFSVYSLTLVSWIGGIKVTNKLFSLMQESSYQHFTTESNHSIRYLFSHFHIFATVALVCEP